MPSIYYQQDGITRYHGDCREVMAELPANSLSAIVTDPPYALVGASRNGSSQPGDLETPYGRSGPSKKRGFMGKEWDGRLPGEDVWREALRIAKPGAHCLAFGGDRTHHRLMCALEDAGWELRTCVYWLFGMGFPKSLDVSKAMDKQAGMEREVIGAKRWEGYGSALKPACEIIIVARKPLEGTLVANCLQWGCGALNIDAGRIVTGDDTTTRHSSSYMTGMIGEVQPKQEPYTTGGTHGRWPATVITDGSTCVLAGFPETTTHAGGFSTFGGVFGNGRAVTDIASGKRFGNDTGSAARFFQACPFTDAEQEARFFYSGKVSHIERKGSTHPTMKPLSLMTYLLKLVTMPIDNLILDPFAGSGTTLLAAHALGLPCIGIEQSEEYCAIVCYCRETTYAGAMPATPFLGSPPHAQVLDQPNPRSPCRLPRTPPRSPLAAEAPSDLPARFVGVSVLPHAHQVSASASSLLPLRPGALGLP